MQIREINFCCVADGFVSGNLSQPRRGEIGNRRCGINSQNADAPRCPQIKNQANVLRFDRTDSGRDQSIGNFACLTVVPLRATGGEFRARSGGCDRTVHSGI